MLEELVYGKDSILFLGNFKEEEKALLKSITANLGTANAFSTFDKENISIVAVGSKMSKKDIGTHTVLL